MIKINLCPIDELESRYWYAPDVALAVIVAAAGFLGIQYYLGQIQSGIDQLSEQTASLDASAAQLGPSVARVKTLERDIEELHSKREALQAITTSKIAKYKAIIVLEHLQSLKPEGVWFSDIKIGIADEDKFEIRGQAFDNILVAELLGSLKSTASQEPDESDLRSQIYFDKVELGESNVPKQAPKGFPELASYTEFFIRGDFVDRGNKGSGKPPNSGEPVARETAAKQQTKSF